MMTSEAPPSFLLEIESSSINQSILVDVGNLWGKAGGQIINYNYFLQHISHCLEYYEATSTTFLSIALYSSLNPTNSKTECNKQGNSRISSKLSRPQRYSSQLPSFAHNLQITYTELSELEFPNRPYKYIRNHNNAPNRAK